MKKFIFIFFTFFSYLFSSEILVIPNNSSFMSAPKLNQIYFIDKAYKEAVLLDKISKMLLNNNTFYTYSQLYEQADVQVYTTTLLEQLKKYLEGLSPYSDTSFENNNIQAGTIEILKECLSDNSQNIPKTILKEIDNSIKQVPSKKFVLKLQHLDKKSEKNFYYLINYFVNLFVDFDNTINQINKNKCPLLFKEDKKTLNKLYIYYRIPAETSLKKSFDIFNKYFYQNFNEVYEKMKYN